MTAPSRPPVIIGAGPAGLACAKVLLEAGLRPIILDESPEPGGQGTRRLTPPMAAQSDRFMGRAYARATQMREAEEDAILARCDWRPNSLVWGIFDRRIEILQGERSESLPYDQVMIATGATDRIMALPGWTLPGVFSLGAAQVALKQHGAFIGARVILAGSSPLLYLAAVQYLRMGHSDLTIVDTATARDKRRAAWGMLTSAPATLYEGLQLLRELRGHKLRRIEGAQLLRATGDTRISGLEIRHADGRHETLGCDALAFGYGLRPETQLAELAGAKFQFDDALRNWFPVIDRDGRAGETLWLAGDSAVTGGRVAAAKSGRLAGLSMLENRPHSPAMADNLPALRGSVSRLRRFQRVMAGAFRWPHETAETLPDSTIVCRCERVSAGEIRQAIRKEAGPIEVNRVKAITRCGMGRCQGRYCGQTLQELTATTSGLPVAQVGRLRAQAPVRPIPLRAALGPKE